jgi:vancomycin permeability regulator SanA
MRSFFNVILQLVGAVLVILFFTALWIVFDGLTDLGEKADVALVLARPEMSQGATDPLLDRAVQIYTDGEFPLMIVSAANATGGPEATTGIVKYLESHGVPASAIIEDHGQGDLPGTALNVVEIMKSRRFHSVMVVSDYYYVTRMKLMLYHDGVTEIEKAHVGKLQKADATMIGSEMVAIYQYIYRIYLLPAAEKIKEEAQVGLGKAKDDATKAKEKMDKGLDGLSK